MTFTKKILLVDDEPHVTAMVRTALESTGRYVIKQERNTQRAMNAARWFQPDLVLFDVASSDVDRPAVARELQQDAALKDTPVVFLSANSAPEGGVTSSGILSGYSFLAGPMSLEQMGNHVADLLNPRSAA